MILRRQLLLTASALSPALALSGCDFLRDLFRQIAETCPSDPAESGGVDWTPDVLHPVFYGFQDHTSDDGAPSALRIWYPTYEGFTANPPILKLCLVRWPVVLFLHGQPPMSCSFADYFLRWYLLPAVLARSGYVVVVPSHDAALPAESGSPGVTIALNVIDWVRSGWEHRTWVDGRAEATAVAGHSYGALLAARVAQARPDISAYIGLSGGWAELHGDGVQSIGAPSFFMWATGDPIGAAFEDLDALGLWSQIPAPKYAAVFPGEHFDYLRPWERCTFPRGSCALIEAVAAELSALFIARYMPVGLSQSNIPITLVPPDVTLTETQQFFAGGHLSGLSQIETEAQCSVDLRWVDGESGSRHLGS